jgi:hypothetical protein
MLVPACAFVCVFVCVHPFSYVGIGRIHGGACSPRVGTVATRHSIALDSSVLLYTIVTIVEDDEMLFLPA